MRWFKMERACRALGPAVMCSAFACGGRAQDDSRAQEPSYSAPRPNPASRPVPSPPLLAQPSPPVNTPPPPTPSTPFPPPLALPGDLARAAAENVLRANCGFCHGSVLTPGEAQDGINYIDDIDKLVETGLILPLNSVSSRVIQVMRNGSQPPPSSGYPAVTEADINIVASYIDNPRFWPILVPAKIVDAGVEPSSVDAGADGG